MQQLKEAIAKGRVRLIQRFPLLLQTSSHLTQHHAEVLGITLEELKEVALLKSLDALARDAGEELVDLLIRYGAESDDEAGALMAKRRTFSMRAVQ